MKAGSEHGMQFKLIKYRLIWVDHMTVPMSFRDSSVVIIETGRTVIRAGHGLHDLLKTPSVVRFLSFN